MTSFRPLEDMLAEYGRSENDPERRESVRQELLAHREAEERQMLQERNRQLESMFTDPDTLGGVWNDDLASATALYEPDPVKAKAGVATVRYLAEATGQSLEEASKFKSLLMPQVSKSVFGEEITDDVAFYGRMGQVIADKRAKADRLRGVSGAAVNDALKDVFEGNPLDWGRNFAEHEDAEAWKIRKATYQKMADLGQEYRPLFETVKDVMARQKGKTQWDEGALAEMKDASRQTLEAMTNAGPEGRQAVYQLLDLFAMQHPEGRKGFWHQMGESMGRMAESMGEGAIYAADDAMLLRWRDMVRDAKDLKLSGEGAGLRNVTTLNLSASGGGAFDQPSDPENERVASEDERQAVLADIDRAFQLNQVRREMRAKANDTVDPIEPVLDWMPEVVEKGLYGAAGSLPFMAVAMVPGVGLPLISAGMGGMEYDRLRVQYPDLDPDKALLIAGISGPVMGYLEKLPLKAVAGQLPMFTAAMNRLTNPKSSFFTKAAIGAGGVLLAENITEGVQDLATPAIQDVIAALDEDVPDVNWSETMSEWAGQRGETFFAVLPFALIGGGVIGLRQSPEVVKAMPESLDTFKLDPEATASIKAALEAGDIETAEAEFQDAWQNRTMQERTATADAVAIEVERENEVIRLDPPDKVIPLPDGRFRVEDPSGNTINTFDSEEAAIAEVADRIAWRESGHEASVRELSAFLSEQDENRRVEVLARSKFAKEALAEGITSPAQLAERLRIAGLKEGDNPRILGENQADLSQHVYADVSRVYLGSTIADVIEERGHGAFRKALQEGRVTMEEAVEAVEAWGQENPQFALREDMTPQERNVVIDEAVADMVKAKFFGNRAALDRLGKLPKAIRAFIARMKEYFREVLKSAAILKQMEQDGKLSEDWQNFLAESVGLKEAAEIDTMAAEIAADFDPDYVPFSLSPSNPQDARYLELAKDPEGNRDELQAMVDAQILQTIPPQQRSKYHLVKVTNLKAKRRPEVVPHGEGFVAFVPESMVQWGSWDRISFRYFQEALWPFSKDTFLRVTNSREDYDHLKKGTHRGSLNRNVQEWESPKEEGGLSVARSLEIPSKYAYYVTGEVIGQGQDGEPVLDLKTAKPKGPLLKYETAQDNLKKAYAGIDTYENLYPRKSGTSQVKSADPVTYDESGNVIPLSQRFNPASDDIRFSLAPGSFVDRMAAAVDARNLPPAERVAAYERAKARMVKLKERFPASGQPQQSIAEINAARKAKEEELFDAKMRAKSGLLDVLEKGETLADLKAVPIVHALLNDVGKLRSKTQERARTGEKNMAEYDDAPYLPSWFYGGDVTPDQAARELHDQGLLPSGDVSALWSAIGGAYESSRIWKSVYADAQKLQREARAEARKEAKEWAKKERRRQPFADRNIMLETFAVLDAVTGVMPKEVRAVIGGSSYSRLATMKDGDVRARFLQERIAMLDKELERVLKIGYNGQLQKLFKKAQPTKGKPGEKPKGKVGAELHRLFTVLQQAVLWRPDQAEAHTMALEAQIAKGEMTAEAEAHAVLEIGLVNLVADWENADSARRSAAVKNATEVYQEGYAKFLLKKTQERERRAALRGVLQAQTGKAGTKAQRDKQALADNGLKGSWKDNLLGLLNFEQVMRWTFGDKSAEAEAFVDMERKAAYQKEDAIQSVLDGIADLFRDMAGSRLKGEKLQYAMAQKSIRFDTDPALSRWADLQLSELEAITATLMWQQEDGQRHMIGHLDENGQPAGPWHYNQTFIDHIEASLSDNARMVRAHIMEHYRGEWETLNPIFRELNGIDLPRHENYAPISVQPMQAQSGQAIDPVTGTTFSAASTTPGSLRTRGTAVAEPKLQNALSQFVAHVKQMEHWKAYAPMVAEAQALLNNRELGNSIEAAAGEQGLKVVRGWVDYFAQGGIRDAAAHLSLNQMLGRMVGRAASIALVGRIGTLVIQSTQLGAALAEMPTGAYVSRMARLMTGNLGWGAALKSDYIQRRIKQMPPIVQQAMEGLKAKKPNQLRFAVSKLGHLLAGADGLFTAGTFAIVHDYQMQQAEAMGLTGAAAERYAQEAAERATDRIAQPTRPGARALFEVSATTPLSRLVWAFGSEARKNLGLTAYGFANRPASHNARVLAYVVLINGVMAAIIRAAWRDMRDDDDDEVFDDKHWNPARLATAVLTEPFYGVPILGGLLQQSVYKASGQYLPEGDLFSGVARAIPAIKRLPDTLSGEQDLEAVLKDVDGILSGMGLFNSNIAAAASLSHLARDLFAVGKNATAEE